MYYEELIADQYKLILVDQQADDGQKLTDALETMGILLSVIPPARKEFENIMNEYQEEVTKTSKTLESQFANMGEDAEMLQRLAMEKEFGVLNKELVELVLGVLTKYKLIPLSDTTNKYTTKKDTISKVKKDPTSKAKKESLFNS